ncbi:unnamed protein product [Mytilus coruscus]|uniref:C1q domain-containing protein n=1 Tax=Mytilus coruscus TaxID=42192 RepID=A0A6J8CKQ3_MYTCO|nr:unnamed protein product [Mytilus coruscus]
MKRLQNTTLELSKKVSKLEQLKSINQALDFRAIQNKVQSLDQKSILLTNNQNARNQDCLALYNVTQVIDNLFKKHIQSFETSRNETLLNIESKQNASSPEIRNEITTVEVAVTSCVFSDQTFSDYIIKFSIVNFHVGINNLHTFKSSGKFVCEIPGLYFISVHIRTSNQNYYFHVRKNNMLVPSSKSDSGDTASTNQISAVVGFQLNDALYVYANNVRIEVSYSCLSIMKVK